MTADFIDQASDLEAATTALALERAMAKAKPEQMQNDDGSWPTLLCRDCDEEIEEPRLLMGKVRCIGCQTAHEKRSKQYDQGLRRGY